MWIALRFLAVLCPVVALAIFGSLEVMKRLENQWVLGDLARRSALISNSIHDYLADSIRDQKTAAVRKLLNRISKDERLTGAVVCSTEAAEISRSDAVPKEIDCQQARTLLGSEKTSVVEVDGMRLHEAVFPVVDEQSQIAYLVVLHDTSYMVRRHDTTRRYVVVLLASLSCFFFLLTLAVYRWTRSESLDKVKKIFHDLLTGDFKTADSNFSRRELSPLVRDLSKVMRELRHAKNLVKDAGTASTWNPARLRREVQTIFGDAQLCVIANREPYVHNRKGSQVEVLLPASGLVTAVEPIVRACSGLWIAHGSGTADRSTSDASGKLLVPPGQPEYALKRVWLTKEEEEGYYYGFSNEGLWPLCHIAHTRPNFLSEDFDAYRRVNERFAQAFLEEQKEPNPIALIQDYHFALLPRMIRKHRPGAILSLFWHIPWPNPEAFGICPWKKDLLSGMLGSDLIGFHTQFHCNNFLDTVDRYLEARVDREQFSVTIRGHVCYVRPFSISVEWPPRYDLPVEQFAKEREDLLDELNLPRDLKFGLGVDRVDYTKGLVERLRSVEKLLDKHPELVGRFTFLQIGAPSRTHIKRYKDLNAEVQEVADQINWKFGNTDVPPISLKLSHHNAPDLYRYYRAADVCFVSSLHDGMNLVAKEYVASRSDNGGALVLSTFTGAARELSDAFLVNPYDLDECAEALHRALTMPAIEKARRMERMRRTVSEKNVYAWAGAFLTEIHRIAQLKGASSAELATERH